MFTINHIHAAEGDTKKIFEFEKFIQIACSHGYNSISHIFLMHVLYVLLYQISFAFSCSTVAEYKWRSKMKNVLEKRVKTASYG